LTLFKGIFVTIEIEVFGQLLPGQPRKQIREFEAPSKAGDIAESIGLDFEEIGLVTINGVQSKLGDPVQSDARICFFPYITGG
jgi:hypothetical protein